MTSEKSKLKHSSITMSILSLEVHVNTRENLLPDPKFDAVVFVVWMFQPSQLQDYISSNDELTLGIIAVSDDEQQSAVLRKLYGPERLIIVETELDLLNALTEKIRELDPDICTGFEVQNSSWGYLIDRSKAHYEYDISSDFSRLDIESSNREAKQDQWGAMKASSVHIAGRHVLNLWRLLRASVNLLRYNLQNCAFHVLKKRVPYYTFNELSRWYHSNKAGQMRRVIKEYCIRARLNLEFLREQETVERTSEQARILGVDFYSVISRGSQFKVESLLVRIAKAENFMLVSPGAERVAQQNALSCIPLVMEPHSNFFTSPVVVLDFQSLYPSIMIAFNYW